MGIKENFTQAVRELAGSGKDGRDKESAKRQPVDDLKRAFEEDARQPKEITLDSEPAPREMFRQPEVTPASEAFFAGGEIPSPTFVKRADAPPTPVSPVSNVQPIPAVQAEPKPEQQSPIYAPRVAPTPSPAPRSGDEGNEITIISKNTIIDGNIRSFADMSVDGDIRGDVETTKNIDLNGKIVGSITCNNALMHTAQVQGNVRMKGNVVMKRDTLLIGDLMSTYAEINGKIKGNLDIVGKAELRGDAVIFGDISASTITVEDGAIIQGYVSTTFLNKDESRNLFPETVIIGGEAV